MKTQKPTNTKVILCAVLTLLISVASCSNDSEEIVPIEEGLVSIPDRSFESQLISQGIDSDGVINQSVLVSDAERVETLNLTYSTEGAIKDLKGIEAFTNLVNLYASGQDIESVDLSKNVNLEKVDLTANYLKSITGLDNAINLKELRLSFNELESLSISNPSLEDLYVSQNNLKNFDASGSPSLKFLLLKVNDLETLDLSANTALEYVNVSSNQLQDLNIQGLSELAYLYVNQNALSSLDVSESEKLIDLKISDNTSLSCIKVGFRQKILSVDKSDYQLLNADCN